MIRLCISSQTPPLVPTAHPGRGGTNRSWRLGADYTPNVGGVVPMMRGLIRQAAGRWVAPNPRWVALGATRLPAVVRTDEGYTLETVPFPEAARPAYRRFKDAIWNSFHGPSGLRFPAEDYRAFVSYNYRMADALLRHVGEYDLFYVNDFQQILVGGLVGSAAPALLRWHIPVDFKGYPEPVRRFFLKAMEGFDGIVVSTRSGLEELIRRGFQGRAFQVYPYVDPARLARPTPEQLVAFRARFGLEESAPVLLSVGRMDPVKRQDLLIEAFARVHRRFPRTKLLLAGGGSFSTRELARGSSDPAAHWAQTLARRIAAHRLGRSVILTGNLSDVELQAAYHCATAFVHPAPWEGFGLVVVEAWLHRRPVVVSRGAGVAELVEDSVNGYTYPPGSVDRMARAIERLLQNPRDAETMGTIGALVARRCTVQRAAPRLREIFDRAIRLYEWSGLRSDPGPGGGR